MRVLLIAFSALALPVTAFAQTDHANAGGVMVHPIRGYGATTAAAQQFEPPDPCRQYRTRRARARCMARLHRHNSPRVESTLLGQDPRR